MTTFFYLRHFIRLSTEIRVLAHRAYPMIVARDAVYGAEYVLFPELEKIFSQVDQLWNEIHELGEHDPAIISAMFDKLCDEDKILSFVVERL